MPLRYSHIRFLLFSAWGIFCSRRRGDLCSLVRDTTRSRSGTLHCAITNWARCWWLPILALII